MHGTIIDTVSPLNGNIELVVYVIPCPCLGKPLEPIKPAEQEKSNILQFKSKDK